MHPYLQTLLAAMTPIGELRLSIPLALTSFDLSITEAYIISVLGNLIPPLVIMLLIDPVAQLMAKHSTLAERFFDWLFARTRKRFSTSYQVLGALALIAFVAVPLPVTGAWTGSLAARLFNIPYWKAVLLIGCGLLIAGIIVTLATLGVASVV